MNKQQLEVTLLTSTTSHTEGPTGKVVCRECGKVIFSCNQQYYGVFLATCDQCAYGSRF